MCRRIMLLTVAIFCSLSAYAVDTAALRARLTSRYGANAVSRGVYVGSELCLMCHNGTRMPDQSAWRATQHASSYIRPLVGWSLIPGKGVLANTTGQPVDDFLAGVDFNAISSPFDAYKPNAPKLAVQANGTYTITIGNLTMPVIYLLQWRGPSGAWEQLFCVRVPVTDAASSRTGAVYSSPLFYTSDGGWQAYAPEAWYDDQGQPRFGKSAVTADVAAVGESHDQNCVGCHATGVRSVEQNAQGEWIFRGFEAVAIQSNNPSYFDYDNDGREAA